MAALSVPSLCEAWEASLVPSLRDCGLGLAGGGPGKTRDWLRDMGGIF